METESTPHGNEHLPTADRLLLQELFDALWLENLYDFQSFCVFNKDSQIELPLTTQKSLIIPTGKTHASYRPIQLTADAVYLRENHHHVPITSLMDVIQQMAGAYWWPSSVSSNTFANYTLLATQQLQFFLDHKQALLEQIKPGQPIPLQCWEQLTCLRDRPFHPFSHAKSGWTQSEVIPPSGSCSTSIRS